MSSVCLGANKTQGHHGAYDAIEEVAEESGIKRDEHRGNSWGRREGKRGLIGKRGLVWMPALCLVLDICIHYLYESIQPHHKLGRCHLNFIV